MRVDLYASRDHYARHLLPIWQALPRHLQGRLSGPDPDAWWVRDDPDPNPAADVVTMVAGFCDLQARAGRGPFVYVEHGAGQAYPGDPRSAGDPSYSGGIGHEDVALYIAPSETVADRWRAQGHRAVAVGCPILDPWHIGARPFTAEFQPTVAITFHWDCGLIPETKTAYRHYENDLAGCVASWRAQGFEVVGHGHPRIVDWLTPVWAALDVRTVNLGWIYDHADVLAVDNSSVAFEFASLGRDVVLMDAPWYRTDVEHGLRFWSYPPGIRVRNGQGLDRIVSELLAGDVATLEASRLMRVGAVREAYDSTDGLASWRAAKATADMEDERWQTAKFATTAH